MIRIDEIYNNIFWPWLKENKVGTRLFFCDPPGRTDPDSLFKLSVDGVVENDYVFLHDQEPVHLDLHQPLFDSVIARSQDVWAGINGTISIIRPRGNVIVSEQGEFVEKLCKITGWQSHYYFYHGWACKDWFRGYDKTFLIPRAQDRIPTKTFISPNRIIAGKRDHRVLFLYNIFKNKLEDNWISAPRVCAYEHVDISVVANNYSNIYPDIAQVFLSANLPKLFPGEQTQLMTSNCLSNFDEAADSLIYVPTETVYFGRRLHITEKTFKAIALEMPFVLVAPAHSLRYMRSYGFQTFQGIFDESYDEETDDIRRIEKVTQLLKDLNDLSIKERIKIHRACLPIVEYNFQHFYGTGFEHILWQELMEMFRGLAV